MQSGREEKGGKRRPIRCERRSAEWSRLQVVRWLLRRGRWSGGRDGRSAGCRRICRRLARYGDRLIHIGGHRGNEEDVVVPRDAHILPLSREVAEDGRQGAEASRDDAERFRVLAEEARELRDRYRESLEEVIEESDRESPALSAQERLMMGNLLTFGELKVSDVLPTTRP